MQMRRCLPGVGFLAVALSALPSLGAQSLPVSSHAHGGATETAETTGETSVPGQLTAPTMGFFFDAERRILRPLRGIPGAAQIGPGRNLDIKISYAVVSPRQDYALAMNRDDFRVLLLVPDDDGFSAKEVVQVPPGPDGLILSPNGVTAGLYYKTAGRIQVLKGLPDKPFVARKLSTVTLPGSQVAMAVSDDGESVLVGVTQDGGSLYLYDTGGVPRFLLPVGHPSSMSFLSNSHDALIADREQNVVYRMLEINGTRHFTSLAAESDGIAGPVAVATSLDNRRAFVANSITATVAIVDLAGGETSLLPCRCEPSGLYRLGDGASVFRLTDLVRSAVWVFDADSVPPRIVFVPSTKPTRPSPRKVGLPRIPGRSR